MRTQVAIARCHGYQKEELDKALGRVLELLGGLEKFIKPGERVLIKPNFLSARKPEEGVNTHPEFIRAVLKKVKAITSDIMIGDSPGGFGKNIDEIYERSGVKQVAQEEGVALVKFDKSRKIGRYPVAVCALEADKIISLPKFKSHDIMLITAAVKNMYGVLPGIFKAKQHSIAPSNKQLAPILVDAYSIRKPDLSIVDAIVSMDGNGPSSGRLRETDFIIASTDGVAVDSVLMKITGLEPFDLHTNKEAHDRGIGEADLEKIDILGETINSVKVDDFRFSEIRLLNRAPKLIAWLLKLLMVFKINIDNSKCRRCKLCEEACPASAISIAEHKCKVDHSKCLLCMCCREICPHGAVVVDKSLLAKKMWG
ncbi:MAG: hypothetical protein COS99_01835 [Candidatus Omnitrophica bacterium CG07_land_8_20_14_0_80_42_15]|uniref:4Fe-4S ferredoxin-type domain-containing protein n=1 Tax=Candidatus Aquitaenariimonas noxiae TaxID=1974741 RepID=A0A2J0KUF3_9BACT|nr:MAG: hypothetical protein COS99_01835 [Candidatus Omnitrophica bacterium CG07_land_8_20_14_0_80_42_15]